MYGIIKLENQYMSSKINKRKKHKPSNIHKKGRSTSSLLSRHPKIFLSLGILLLITSGLILTVGYISNAKIGLSMLSLFFGVGLVILSNASLSKVK